MLLSCLNQQRQPYVLSVCMCATGSWWVDAPARHMAGVQDRSFRVSSFCSYVLVVLPGGLQLQAGAHSGSVPAAAVTVTVREAHRQGTPWVLKVCSKGLTASEGLAGVAVKSHLPSGIGGTQRLAQLLNKAKDWFPSAL